MGEFTAIHTRSTTMTQGLSISHHDALSVSGIGNRSRIIEEEEEQHHPHHDDDHNKAYDITQFLLKMMQKDSPFFQNKASLIDTSRVDLPSILYCRTTCDRLCL